MKTTFAALISLALIASAQAPVDYSKVQIKTNKISDNFYTLDGQGGTIGVLAGPDGVFMVDSQFAPLSDKLAAAIHQISDRPIRYLVNTHVHGDHTGGNENFGKMGVTILARENLRNRLMHPAPAASGAPGVPTMPVGLPVITYNAMVTFHMNGEDVQLIPIPVAHTDGDTMVRFVNNDVIMTGDFYRSIQYPEHRPRQWWQRFERHDRRLRSGACALRAQHEDHPRSRTHRRSERRDGASRHDPGDSRSRCEAGRPREVSG